MHVNRLVTHHRETKPAQPAELRLSHISYSSFIVAQMSIFTQTTEQTSRILNPNTDVGGTWIKKDLDKGAEPERFLLFCFFNIFIPENNSRWKQSDTLRVKEICCSLMSCTDCWALAEGCLFWLCLYTDRVLLIYESIIILVNTHFNLLCIFISPLYLAVSDLTSSYNHNWCDNKHIDCWNLSQIFHTRQMAFFKIEDGEKFFLLYL